MYIRNICGCALYYLHSKPTLNCHLSYDILQAANSFAADKPASGPAAPGLWKRVDPYDDLDRFDTVHPRDRMAPGMADQGFGALPRARPQPHALFSGGPRPLMGSFRGPSRPMTMGMGKAMHPPRGRFHPY